MMTEDQQDAVKVVFQQFLAHDYKRNWTKIDDLLYELDFLSDEQTIMETEVQIYRHSQGDLKCSEDHGQSVCLVPKMMEAVEAICELYQEAKTLHAKNKYILHNYLAVSHENIIYVESIKD